MPHQEEKVIPIQRLLIANRGEPAMRAIRTCRALGISAAVIYFGDDAASNWVSAADFAYRLHAREQFCGNPYMDAEQIALIAAHHECSAVWPGWGFLAEEADFAERIEREGMLWVGPRPDAMRLLGSKLSATDIAKEAGFETVPEYILKDGGTLEGMPEMTFPLVIKPVLGGGGKGQQVVESKRELEASLEAVARQARSLYGNGDLIIQRYLRGARHIELQILRDSFGEMCIVGIRDCSIQRRNQKIVEEAPAQLVPQPALDQAMRATRALCERANYTSAGTIETLLHEGHLYFLEVNTRLQVEHPVTEECTRIRCDGYERPLDMLAEMLHIAAGESLSFHQEQIQQRGYALEARIYAEDPEGGFVPTPGRVCFLKFPEGEEVRVDTAMAGPEEVVSRCFDPMVAKVIVRGADRKEAVERLRAALEKTVILGIQTNIDFLRRITSHAEFVKGDYHTGFIRQSMSSLAPSPSQMSLAAAIASIISYRHDYEHAVRSIRDASIVSLEDLFNRMPDGKIAYRVTILGDYFECVVHQVSEGRYALQSGDAWGFLDVDAVGSHVYCVRDVMGKSHETFVHRVEGKFQMVLDGEHYALEVLREGGNAKRQDPHVAPYGGKLIAVRVQEGARVVQGDELYVLEAMKMESVIRAAHEGIVERVLRAEGDALESGEHVMQISSTEELEDEETLRKQLVLREHDRIIVLLFSHPVFLFDEKTYLFENWHRYEELFRALPSLYFKGYDILADAAQTAFALVAERHPERSVRIIERSVQGIIACLKLRDEDRADSLLEYLKTGKLEAMDTASRDMLSHVLNWYGGTNLRNRDELETRLPRMLLGIKSKGLKQLQVIIECIEHLVSQGRDVGGLVTPVRMLLDVDLLEVEPQLKTRLLRILRLIDREAYYQLEQPPVALCYLEEYEKYLSNPLLTLTEHERAHMRERITSTRGNDGAPFEDLPPWLATLYGRWFEGFAVRPLPVSARARDVGVMLYELVNAEDKTDRRLLAVGFVADEHLDEEQGHIVALRTERTSIEAYRSIAQYDVLGGKYAFNHVFLITPSSLVFSWKPVGAPSYVLTPKQIKASASRILGFARGLRIAATELIVNLERHGEVFSHLLEIRHTEPAGLISRPPYLVTERMPEQVRGARRVLDEKQERLGKLLNEDRARLLFDDGLAEELAFPEVDDVEGKPIGLQVYRGNIHGVPALAYAGDFRIKGGALGEREGKKLAASVVFASVCDMPLIGIHDGAGADIRGSVASLGWAGAYFGAIANTGGFSNSARFWRWFQGHHERAYFEKVFRHFGLKPDQRGRWSQRRNAACHGHFLHLHLSMGATVGMLVYGAAISSMSLMVDHPEVYRVLTGAGTVKKVTGETTTNYDLGGAKMHTRYSGDVDIAYATEEEAIAAVRRLAKLLFTAPGKESSLEHRDLSEQADAEVTREKLRSALDPKSWTETRGVLKGTKNLVTAYGSVEGMTVGFAASLSPYGIRNARSLKKLFMLYAGCQEFHLPCFPILRGKWYGIQQGAMAKVMYLRGECDRLFGSLTVPRIACAIGPHSLDVGLLQLADIIYYIPDGTESNYDRSRADIMAHVQVPNIGIFLRDAARLSRYLLGYQGGACDVREEGDLTLPESFSEAYDMRQVIASIVDEGSFLELLKADALPLIIGFASVAGYPVGIIADNPSVAAGAQTAYALAKFTKCTRLCERLGLPLIELNDSPAFQPGSRQERMGIQSEGGKSLREECLGSIPRLSVTLRQNYGGRLIHANLRTLGPGRDAIICEGARVGVMGAEGAVGVLFGKQLMGLPPEEREREYQRHVEEYIRQSLDPSQALHLGYIDKIVPTYKVRAEIRQWMKRLVGE